MPRMSRRHIGAKTAIIHVGDWARTRVSPRQEHLRKHVRRHHQLGKSEAAKTNVWLQRMKGYLRSWLLCFCCPGSEIDLETQWTTTISPACKREKGQTRSHDEKWSCHQKTPGVHVFEQSWNSCIDEAKERRRSWNAFQKRVRQSSNVRENKFWRAINFVSFFALQIGSRTRSQLRSTPPLSEWIRKKSQRPTSLCSKGLHEQSVRAMGDHVLCCLNRSQNRWKDKLNQRSKNSLWKLFLQQDSFLSMLVNSSEQDVPF